MAYIKSSILGIDITAQSDRQMVSKFYVAMSRKIPLFARRLHDYMIGTYIPKHPRTSIPLAARTLAELGDTVKKHDVVELPDGWYCFLCRNSNGFKSDLQRVADAFGIVLNVQLHGTLESRSKTG